MYPKQFLPLVHDTKSLLQQTLERVVSRADCVSPIVVCNEEHRFIVAEQLMQIDQQDALILLEPEGRNTAPAIGLAALLAEHLAAGDVLLVMPADHVMQDLVGFNAAVDVARAAAAAGKLVTFGVQPLTAETGYGYIQVGAASDYAGVAKVAAFHEKPDLSTAQHYLESGDYLWNGGIFMFTPAHYLQELSEHAAEVADGCRAAFAKVVFDHDFVRIDAAAFSALPAISVDHAVIEKTKNACVVPLDVGWNDVGSWSALWDVSPKDEHGNVSKGDVLIRASTNCHIISETKVVAALGLEGLVVVETDDAVLVASKEHVQDVKLLVESLSQQDRSQVRHHRKVYRPWGWYDSIDVGPRFQVKRIHVKPGAKLSVQKHRHRAEHWVVVSGVAEVLNGETTFQLTSNESTYIPIGQVHALHNPSATETLEIIEVQTGDYLGEDDIIRLEDRYGRGATEA